MRVHRIYRARFHAVSPLAPEKSALVKAMTVSLMTALMLSVAAMMLHSARAQAQTDLFKCTDGQRVTYSSTACDKLGLKSAGAIADRITVISGDRPAAKAASGPAPVSAPKGSQDEEDKARKSAGAIRPVNPLVERLLK